MKRFMFVLALLLVVGLSSALAQSEAEALVTQFTHQIMRLRSKAA